MLEEQNHEEAEDGQAIVRKTVHGVTPQGAMFLVFPNLTNGLERHPQITTCFCHYLPPSAPSRTRGSIQV